MSSILPNTLFLSALRGSEMRAQRDAERAAQREKDKAAMERATQEQFFETMQMQERKRGEELMRKIKLAELEGKVARALNKQQPKYEGFEAPAVNQMVELGADTELMEAKKAEERRIHDEQMFKNLWENKARIAGDTNKTKENVAALKGGVDVATQSMGDATKLEIARMNLRKMDMIERMRQRGQVDDREADMLIAEMGLYGDVAKATSGAMSGAGRRAVEPMLPPDERLQYLKKRAAELGGHSGESSFESSRRANSGPVLPPNSEEPEVDDSSLLPPGAGFKIGPDGRPIR